MQALCQDFLTHYFQPLQEPKGEKYYFHFIEDKTEIQKVKWHKYVVELGFKLGLYEVWLNKTEVLSSENTELRQTCWVLCNFFWDQIC